jgi:predicted unusual protein kinase regulating ubiquinone biosynthesis (AarF/ABC1/UbiB family)
LVDKYIRRDEESTRQERANELLGLIQRIGPTAIKVGQALSVRPDLIPLEYADTLATLQDQVPPFSSGEAREILFQDLGERRMSSIQNLNFQQGPVASASIGQVYRCFANDLEVAIKVQRPNVLAEIALDLHIVREFAPYYRKLTGAATDLQGLADEWGRGFIAELDYHTEAANTKKFNVEMEKRKLTTVAAPVVVDDYSTDRVLTTQWVDGCRLDESNANDVPRLCSVALNAYLVMLLELQSLHCDPHPGNLLRSKEGKLVILDWGMTLDTDPDLQYSLLEFVAHLTSSDYDKVPEDLVKLGFLKEDRLESVKSSGFLEPLVYFLQQAKQGGGGEKVRERIFTEFREKYPGMDDDELRIQMRSDMKQQMEEVRKRESAVTGITIEVEELQKRNRDAFRIPPWFLYTSRAFLTLEGVSLQADENFSIIQSCFPYVAKRLVGDDSPRAQKALRDLLYGAGDYLDVERVSDLANGFSRYTTTTKSVNHEIKERNIGVELVVKEPGVENRVDSQYGNRDAKIAQAEAALLLAKDSADILLAADGNLVQDILIDETALATSANVKDALRTALVDRPKQIRESLPLIGSILPPSPFEIGVAPFLKKTKQEENAQELIGKISTSFPRPSAPSLPGVSTTDAVPFATESSNTRFDSRIDPEQAAMVAKAIRENLPKYAPLVGQLGGKFASILLKTASNNIDTTLEEMDHNNDEQDQLVKAAARSLSTAATRGADAISRRVQQEDR